MAYPEGPAVWSAVATFLGGFATAVLVSRWSSMKGFSNWFKDESSSQNQVAEQEKHESGSKSPPTPAVSEPRHKVTFGGTSSMFEDDESDAPEPLTVFTKPQQLQSIPSGTSVTGPHKPNLHGLQSQRTAFVAPDLDDESHDGAMLRSAPSGIPTEIHLPELVFGGQITGCGDRPPVLPFSTFAACRLLDVKPDSQDNGHIFEGLRTIAAYYLRADIAAICECIQTFGLNDLLYAIARLECDFQTNLAVSTASSAQAEIARAAELAVDRHGPRRLHPPAETQAVCGVLAALMHEVECILHEYLSFNWDRVDQIFEANKHLLRKEGLVCAWKTTASLGSLPSAPSMLVKHGDGDGDSTASSSTASLADLVRSYPDLGSLDEWLSRRTKRRTGSDVTEAASEAALEGDSGVDGGGRPLEATRSIGSEADALERRFASDADENGGEPPRRRSSEAAGPPDRETGAGEPSQTESRKKLKARAVKNWKRAKAAVAKKITKDMLGPQRRFRTLRQMFEDLNRPQAEPPSKGRQPIILLLGGGMAAGKSTVRDIIGRDGFWSTVGCDAVVVEADAIKNQEVLKRSLNRLDGLGSEADLQQYMHEYSTKAAEAMLVAAVNEQRDIIFDGTMTWAPFVEQTIKMVRDHKHDYKRGPGWGTADERYWEVDHASTRDVCGKRPYRIEFIGVTCDPGLAVARGIWRKIRTGRSVPLPSQLKSHRLFSENFEDFARLVDSATLFHTGSALTTFNKGTVDLSPVVIAHRSTATRGEFLINPAAYESFQQKKEVVDEATCRHDLFKSERPCDGKVPTSNEEEMSMLRHVFRAADRKERKQLRRAVNPTIRRHALW